MTENILIPSIDMRIGSLLEFNRRHELEAGQKSRTKKHQPTITLSREFGCEAYPTAEIMQQILEKRTGQAWLIIDKGLLEEVARDHNLSEEVLRNLGEKNLFLDEMLATFSSRWKSDKDTFRLLCRHITALAGAGNVIIVGRASTFITQTMKNCCHFRLYASAEFKNRSIRRRLDLTEEEAEKLIARMQKQRDRFIRDFIDRDPRDMSVYDLLFNNDRNSPEKIARTIVEYVLGP
jgi:cytidylate kinase